MEVIALTVALTFFADNLPASEVTEAMCLTEAVHYEANGEGWHGKKAVANVVIRRAEVAQFPDTLCDVLESPNAFSHRRQGDDLGSVVITEPGDLHGYYETLELVVTAMEGNLPDNTQGADHFFNPSLSSPNWAQNPLASVRIGNHRFVKLYP